MSDAAHTEHTWRSRDGLTLYARVYGAASPGKLPVICIPGLTRNSRDFEEVAPWIAARGRQVFAVDLRGRGGSDRAVDPRTYNPRTYAIDMLALLASIGAERAIFVGTSLGGLVMMSLAMASPRAIGGGVMNDVGPRVAKAGLARIRSYVGKTAPVETWEDAAAYAKAINGVAFPDMAPDAWAAVARRLFRDESGRPVLDYDPHIFRPASPLLTWLTRPLLWSAFRRLGRAGPLLLIHGELTDILDSSTIGRMQASAPRMRTASVPRIGHAPALSEPQAQAAMADLLDTAP